MGCGSQAAMAPDLAPAACTLDRVRDPVTMECLPAPGALCGPCGDACTAAGGTCVMEGCSTPCDDVKVFCPKGYRCDNQHCVSALDAGCHGCYEDGDCPAGQACNVNNKQCVPAPMGPDARIEMVAFDFTNMGVTSRNLTWSIGFFSTPDPSFDPFALMPGQCGSERSTLTENAPFPVGPLRDAGAKLTLQMTGKSIDFLRESDPQFGYSYSPTAIMTTDFLPGAASWTGAGGADVGAFTVAGVIPAGFTTNPDVLAGVSASGDVTVTFSPAPESGVGTWLEVSWNEVSGNTVTSLTRIACRADDGATTITIPAAQLANVPLGTDVNLFATRASVRGVSASGLAGGRATFGVQAVGTLRR
jgi:hypothetical protein